MRSAKVISFSETIRDSRTISHRQADDKHTQIDLPDELWEQILSPLTLKENIRASAVSKRFLSIATSVQKANKPPLLLSAPKHGDTYKFYEPCKRRLHCLDLPELRGARFCYTRNGWLLMFNPDSLSLFFFNPYFRETVKLPSLKLANQAIAFSADPTSPECVIFSPSSFNNQGLVQIRTCRPGENEWTIVNYQSEFTYFGGIRNNIVFCKGVFYCLSLFGALGVYSPEKSSWSIQLPPEYHPDSRFRKRGRNCRFMAEHDGAIIAVYILPDEYLSIYKLDPQNSTWVKMKTLEGMTVFANMFTSHVRSDILGNMQNNVCFSKVGCYGKHCVSYSLKKCRYLSADHIYDQGKQDTYESIWIDAPEDLSVFL